MSAIMTAWKIKKLNIAPEDLLISISQVDFIENCFMSYHRNNYKVGLLMDAVFRVHYDSQNSVYSRNYLFKFNKASWFYNAIFEPCMRLNRSLMMFYGRGLSITRYQKPVNEIFDRVYILNSASR